MVERLKQIKETLMACIEKEVCNMEQADTKELGEAIDMIKDIEEAVYYCTITKAMEGKNNRYYDGGTYPTPYYCPDPNAHVPKHSDVYDPHRDIDRQYGKMYYSGDRGGMNGSNSPSGGNSSSSGNNGGTRGYYDEREYMYPLDMRDNREGRSPVSRKGYMEGKEMHHPKEKQMKELEKYMQELTSDITEMIQGTSPEEKQLLQKKIATLAEKVGQVSV
jgi:hypothetical protein